MNRNRLLLLIIITIAAIVAVMLLDRSGRQGAATDSQALVPGLGDAVNDLDALDIIAPGGELAVRLRRDDERWRVAEKDDYEAEFSQVVELLRTLADAELVEPRTDNPDWYDRLGVQDPGNADATGRRLDFPGRERASVIVGQADPTGQGSYVRRADEARSWLADRVIEVPADPVEWLEPGIMDISSADIASIEVRHADGEIVRLDRAETAEADSAEFVLRDVPEGRAAGTAWKRTSLANGLRALNLEDVRRFAPPPPDGATRVVFTTTDGLEFSADLFARDEKYWAHFNVAVDPDAPPPEARAGESDESGEGEGEGEGAEPAAAELADTASEPAAVEGEAAVPEGEDGARRTSDPVAERLANAVAADARLSPWLFAIPKSRYDDLTRRLEDYLEPVEPESGEQ